MDGLETMETVCLKGNMPTMPVHNFKVRYIAATGVVQNIERIQ